MEVVLFVLGIVLVFYLYPYLRTGVKRVLMVRKLKKSCRENGHTLVTTHRFWMFAHRLGKNCDFYIETPDTVYAVKLFGMRKRSQYLIFPDENSFYVRNFIFVFSPYGAGRFYNGSSIDHRDSKPRKIPDYNFRACFRDEWYLKSVCNILLLNPTCKEVHIGRVSKESILDNGGVIAGMTLYTLSGLLGEMENPNLRNRDAGGLYVN